jgi:Asp/Glu/hydantoin racemase
MEDAIEICSGCGKMPRVIDNLSGQFICSRCGNRVTMHVNTDNYENVVTELDRKFHMATQKQRIESAASAPVEMKKSAKKSAKSARKPAKKTAKKIPAKKSKRRK